MHRLNVFTARLTMAVAATLLVSAGIADAQTKIKPGFNLFSPQDDVQIGQQSAAQAEQQLPIVNDAQTNAYITRIESGWRRMREDRSFNTASAS